MKKIFAIISLLVLFASCGPAPDNGGYDYSSKPVAQETQNNQKRHRRNYAVEVGRTCSGGTTVFEFTHEGHKYLMAQDFGFVHSASCPCGWINKLQ